VLRTVAGHEPRQAKRPQGHRRGVAALGSARPPGRVGGGRGAMGSRGNGLPRSPASTRSSSTRRQRLGRRWRHRGEHHQPCPVVMGSCDERPPRAPPQRQRAGHDPRAVARAIGHGANGVGRGRRDVSAHRLASPRQAMACPERSFCCSDRSTACRCGMQHEPDQGIETVWAPDTQSWPARGGSGTLQVCRPPPVRAGSGDTAPGRRAVSPKAPGDRFGRHSAWDGARRSRPRTGERTQTREAPQRGGTTSGLGAIGSHHEATSRG